MVVGRRRNQGKPLVGQQFTPRSRVVRLVYCSCGLTLSVHTLRFSAFSAQQWQGLTSDCRISRIVITYLLVADPTISERCESFDV